jgi:hypothetical protein
MNKKRRRSKNSGEAERGKIYKLVMNLYDFLKIVYTFINFFREFSLAENSKDFGSKDFELLVDSAIKRGFILSFCF